ncbi:MFS transporter [Mycolicibacterium elephantis]|nr:MFS transporter [Mycolicibacterium elephantis]MCV7223411.1 MFS transporter [Mycolicibacterium elephantis]
MAMYFVNYLDRTNLGIAKASISEDLQLSTTMFGFAAGIFFIGYVLVEVPSNLALHRFGARRWLARIAVSWGIIVVAIGFAPNAATLLVLRFLLGVAEAGLFPGVIFYLSRWFPTAYRARVVAMFMLAIPIAAAVGTPLAAWLIHVGDDLFEAGWQFMMICCGIPAVVLGVACWFYLTDRPADAHWLSDEERRWLTEVLAAEESQVNERFDFPLRRALGSIPYSCAAVGMYLWSRHADRTAEHVWHVGIPMLVGGLTIPVALYLDGPVLVMIAVTVVAVGVFGAIPSFWALPSRFLTGVAAAGAIALINSIGNLGGFAAPYVTGALVDLTGSERAGMWTVGAVMVLSAAVVVALRATPARDRRSQGSLGPNRPVSLGSEDTREGNHADRNHD